jgi:hypothetical protein
MCQKWIAHSRGAPVVEVEQSAKPFAALNRCVAVGRSHRLHCEFANDWIYHRNPGELHCGSNSLRTPPLDWPPIDPSKAFSCLYDETTVEPPRPSGPVEFKNQEKVIVSLDGEDRPGVALVNRKPNNPANMYVRINGNTVEVPRDSVRRV